MLTVFPVPYEDELLYGVVSRFTRAAPLKRIHELRLNRRSRFGLCNIDDWLSHFSLRDADALLEHFVLSHSLLPYRLPFMRAAVRPFVFSDLLAQRSLAKLSRLSAYVIRTITASVSVAQLFRYCPRCVRLDIQRVGEPFWHRGHQLPCTAVCLEHECHLITHQPSVAWSTGPPVGARYDAKADTATSGWPLLVRLAEFDHIFLRHGCYGFAGDHLANALQLEPNVVAVPNDLRRKGVVARIVDFESAPWRSVFANPSLPLLALLGGKQFRVAVQDPTNVPPAAVVVLLALLRIDPTPLLTDAPQFELLSREVDTCGSRFCPHYTPIWFSVARERQDQVGGVVYAVCQACGFRARVSPGTEQTVISNRGSFWAEMKSALASEGILTAYEQRSVLELSATADLLRRRTKDERAKALPHLPIPKRKKTTNGARGSIDGPHFRSRFLSKRRPKGS